MSRLCVIYSAGVFRNAENCGRLANENPNRIVNSSYSSVLFRFGISTVEHGFQLAAQLSISAIGVRVLKNAGDLFVVVTEIVVHVHWVNYRSRIRNRPNWVSCDGLARDLLNRDELAGTILTERYVICS